MNNFFYNQKSFFTVLLMALFLIGCNPAEASNDDDDDITENTTTTITQPISQTDAQGDNNGPTGNYTLPTHESFSNQQDITNIKVTTSGGNMTLEVTMAEITNTWGPDKNDFDHVAFHIFIANTNADGSNVLPMLNSSTPSDMGAWDYYALMTGWSTTMYQSADASATNKGTEITTLPTSTVDSASKTITFEISAESLDSPANLSGWKIYIATWDEDMGKPRSLTTTGGEYVYAGGDGTVDPLIMDDITVITIK